MLKKFILFPFVLFTSLLFITIILAVEEPIFQDEDLVAKEEQNEETEIGKGEVEQDEASITEILEGSSGVRVQTMCTNCNIANVTMCGQTGDRVQIWQNGLPVVGGLGAIYSLSVMPSEAIANTEIIRGAGTVLSGSEAGTGAIFINTRVPEKRPYLLVSLDTGSFNWFGQKLMTYGQLGRFGGEIIFTHSQSDGINPNEPDGLNLEEGDDFTNDLAAFHRTTYEAAVTYKIFDRSSLRLSALRYREDQEDGKGAVRAFFPGFPAIFYNEDVDIRKDEYALSWDLEFKDRSKITLRCLSSYREQDTSDDRTPPEEGPYMFVDETARNAEARYEKALFGKHVLTTGLTYRNFVVHGTTTEATGVFREGQDIYDRIRQDGAYAQIEFSLPKQINLTTGLRYDDFRLHSEERAQLLDGSRIPPRVDDVEEFLPRIRLDWKPSKSLHFSLSAGQSFIAPRPFFERVCCGMTITLNPYIKPQESRDILFDYTYIPRPWMKFRTSFFYSDIENYIQKLPRSAIDYIPNSTQVNYAQVDLKGAELSAEFRFFDRLSTGFEFSSVEAESDDPTIYIGDTPLFDLPPGQIPYFPEDQGSAFIRWDDQKRGFQASAQAQYTDSMYIQMIEEAIPSTVDAFVVTRDYWVFNLKVQARFYENFSVFAGMDNITDEYQDWLGDPRYEYNWGPLRGRYIYFGVLFEM